MPNNVTDTQPLGSAAGAQTTAAPHALDTGAALEAAPTGDSPSGGSGDLLGGLLGGGGGNIPGTTKASFLGLGLPMPTFLIKAAGALGFKWPESDEMELFRIGKNYIASGIEYMKIRGEVDEAIKGLLSNNESDGLDAFDRFQRRLTSLAGSHMMISGTSAPAIGVAYLAAGGLVLALKVQAIMILIEATIVMAMQAFGSVLGPLGVGAFAAKLAALRAQLEAAIRAVETAMKPVLKVAEQVIGIYTKVATPMLQKRPMNKNSSAPALTPGPGGARNGNPTPGTPLAANDAEGGHDAGNAKDTQGSHDVRDAQDDRGRTEPREQTVPTAPAQPAETTTTQATASDADAWDSVIDPADQPSRNLKVPAAPPRTELAPGAVRG